MTTSEKPVRKTSWVLCSALVLLILMVLAMVVLNAGFQGMRVDPRSKAANDITQLQTACLNYYTEYSALPESSENGRLIKILCGDNPRGIVFLVVRPSDLNPRGEMIDPSGTPFRITFESNNKVHMISAGPDKIFGTPDDINNQ